MMLPGVELARRRRIRNFSHSQVSHSSLLTINVEDRSSHSTLPHQHHNHHQHNHQYHNPRQHKEPELQVSHSYRTGSNSRQLPNIAHEQLHVSPREIRGSSDSSYSGRNNILPREISRQTSSAIFLQSHSENNLQGPALEARNRLDERLRTAALGHRRHTTGASVPRPGEHHINTAYSDDEEETFWDEEEWVMSVRESLAAGAPGSRDSWQSEWRIRAGRSGNLKKGMSKLDLSSLPREVFRHSGKKQSDMSSTTKCTQVECSICLEFFVVGQILFHLPCNHRFHPQCLTPWLEGHKQCPYCRLTISVIQPDSHPSSTSRGNSDLQQTDSVSWLSAFETGIHRLNLLRS